MPGGLEFLLGLLMVLLTIYLFGVMIGIGIALYSAAKYYTAATQTEIVFLVAATLVWPWTLYRMWRDR